MQHELGHYFDLFHTHQVTNSSDSTEFGVYGSEYVNGDYCDFRGDGICDTPAAPNLTSLTDESCNYISDSTIVDNHGHEYDGEECLAYPPCENYGGPDTRNLMSYTPGNCREHFTYQQNEKIALIALSERSDYLMDIDPNDDGMINIMDLVLIVNMLLANEYNQIADINEDGELNILDIVKYNNIILNT